MSKRARFRCALVTGVLMLGAAVLAGVGYRHARADPVVRRMTVRLPHWPAGAAPVTVALLSDIHLGGPAMDASRLARIVAQVDALRPDLVLIAGDFVFGHDPAKGVRFAGGLAAPLARLRAPLGVVAVLGNHDHWTAPAAVTGALGRAGVTVLANQAAERGPLAIVGVDDAFSGHAAPGAALAAARRLPGAPVLLTHTPGLALPPGAAPLVLAGHTHCGQVVLLWVGTVVATSPLLHRRLFDPRYRCGAVRDPGRLTIVTAGLGTSVVPLRFGAPPDLWLLRLGP
ncbi:metallophosphoesterase [uncultured Sphingomonas sp.]|uniref:metallophosphoesterase n=1 Tax=uncultured Sphingomonas sp. TaxID=158754 RepID=UPI0035CC4CCC